ncbi:MAG: ABC transporter ATP-binding protein [Bacillota bacterium]|nr:ABC transporter ATP-binding protein [Bacillota bacterium]
MTIKVSNLEFGYSFETVLNKISFNINNGEIISILGPNGAGKSTLIKCLDGLLNSTSGDIEINGKNMKYMNRDEISKKIAYVPQATSTLFSLRVFDMIMLGRRNYTSLKNKKTDYFKVLESLKMLNIEHLAMKNFNQLSGGEKQKVILARAIVQETDIILLDEATSNLDIRHQLEVMEIIKKLSRNFGITIIMILHDLNIASRYSDRIIILNNGDIAAMGIAKEVITEEIISSIYGVESYITNVGDKTHIVPLKVKVV